MEIEVASGVEEIRKLQRSWSKPAKALLSPEQQIAAAARKWYEASILATKLRREYVAILNEHGCLNWSRNGGRLCSAYINRGGSGDRCSTCQMTEPIYQKRREALSLARNRLMGLKSVISKFTPK